MKADEEFGVGHYDYIGNGEFVGKSLPPAYGGGQPQPPLGAQTYGTMG